MQNPHTVFEYLYRDAGNNKAYGSVVLQGSISSEDKVKLIGYLNDGQWFIAEQVSLPPLFEELWKYSGGQTDEDFPFHEFLDIRPANEQDLCDSEAWGAAEELLKNFQNVGSRWDIYKSQCSSY